MKSLRWEETKKGQGRAFSIWKFLENRIDVKSFLFLPFSRPLSFSLFSSLYLSFLTLALYFCIIAFFSYVYICFLFSLLRLSLSRLCIFIWFHPSMFSSSFSDSLSFALSFFFYRGNDSPTLHLSVSWFYFCSLFPFRVHFQASWSQNTFLFLVTFLY